MSETSPSTKHALKFAALAYEVDTLARGAEGKLGERHEVMRRGILAALADDVIYEALTVMYCDCRVLRVVTPLFLRWIKSKLS